MGLGVAIPKFRTWPVFLQVPGPTSGRFSSVGPKFS